MNIFFSKFSTRRLQRNCKLTIMNDFFFANETRTYWPIHHLASFHVMSSSSSFHPFGNCYFFTSCSSSSFLLVLLPFRLVNKHKTLDCIVYNAACMTNNYTCKARKLVLNELCMFVDGVRVRGFEWCKMAKRGESNRKRTQFISITRTTTTAASTSHIHIRRLSLN